MANYPTADPSFASRNTGDVIQPSHINGLQDEVVAIGAALRGTLQHAVTVGTGGLTVSSGGFTVSTGNTALGQALSVAGITTLASQLRVPVASTTLSGGSTRFDNVVVPSTAVMLRIDPNSTTIAISGFSGGAAGRVLYVVNVDGAADVKLMHGSGNSSNDCQMTFTGNANKALGTAGTAILIHDGSFWRGL